MSIWLVGIELYRKFHLVFDFIWIRLSLSFEGSFACFLRDCIEHNFCHCNLKRAVHSALPPSVHFCFNGFAESSLDEFLQSVSDGYNDLQKTTAELSRSSKFRVDISRSLVAGSMSSVLTVQHFNLRCNINSDLQWKARSMDRTIDQIRGVLLRNPGVSKCFYDSVFAPWERIPKITGMFFLENIWISRYNSPWR